MHLRCNNSHAWPNIKLGVPNNKEQQELPVSSSTPPKFPPQQEALFREVLALLSGRGIPFVVSGAFALQAHTGIWRDTKDLDLFLPAEHAQRAMEVLLEDGFHSEVYDPVWLAKAHRGDFFVDLITGMSNGVIRVDGSWIERGKPAQLFGVCLKVLAPEELIASKLFVLRRERFDGADIVHVIYGTRGKLDWQRLLNLIGDHWTLLFWALVLFQYSYPAHSDLVPREIWDELIGRFQAEVHEPNPDAQFRGSLVDPLMFAIDVKEWGMPDLNQEYRRRRSPKSTKACTEPAA